MKESNTVSIIANMFDVKLFSNMAWYNSPANTFIIFSNTANTFPCNPKNISVFEPTNKKYLLHLANLQSEIIDKIPNTETKYSKGIFIQLEYFPENT